MDECFVEVNDQNQSVGWEVLDVRCGWVVVVVGDEVQEMGFSEFRKPEAKELPKFNHLGAELCI